MLIICLLLSLGNIEEKIKKVKEAKQRERNQKGMAQRRSELLQAQPIVPNLWNVESKLKAMLISSAYVAERNNSESIVKKRSKPQGKVKETHIFSEI